MKLYAYAFLLMAMLTVSAEIIDVPNISYKTQNNLEVSTTFFNVVHGRDYTSGFFYLNIPTITINNYNLQRSNLQGKYGASDVQVFQASRNDYGWTDQDGISQKNSTFTYNPTPVTRISTSTSRSYLVYATFPNAISNGKTLIENYGVNLSIGAYLADPDITACGTYNDSNTAYTLTGDLSSSVGCIGINGSNVSFDGGGFNLDGDAGSSDYGIFGDTANDLANITIKNFNFTDWGGCAYFAQGIVEGLEVINSSCGGSSRSGVTLAHGDTNPFKNVHIQGFNFTTTQTSTMNGMAVVTSSSRVTNLTIEYNNCTTNTSTSNTGRSCIYFSISGQPMLNATIRNNYLYIDNPGTGACSAIRITAPKNIEIYNNTIIANCSSWANPPVDFGTSSSCANTSFVDNNFTLPLTAQAFFRAPGSASADNCTFNNSVRGNKYTFWNGTNLLEDFPSAASACQVNYSNTNESIWNVTAGASRGLYFDAMPIQADGSVCGSSPPSDTNKTDLSNWTVSPLSPNTTSNLTCNLTANGTFTTYNANISWYANGTNMTALACNQTGIANNTAYSLCEVKSGNLSVDANWSCSIILQNGTNTSTHQTANVTIQAVTPPNTPPFIPYINLTPLTAYGTSTLSCNITAVDNQSASINISYNWFKGGTNQTGLANSVNVTNNTNTTVSTISSLIKGDQWQCKAYAWDGSEYSALNSSNTVTIQNTAPTNATLTALANGSNKHWFWFNVSFDDADGAADITAWNITSPNGTCVNYSNSASGNTRSISMNCSGGNLTTTINLTIIDASGASTWIARNNTFPNNAPTLGNPAISPASAYDNTSLLNCTNGSYSDADGDSQGTSIFRWFKNGSAIAGQTAQTLANTSYGISDIIGCEETAFDNYSKASAPANSSNVTIQNSTIPHNANITITVILVNSTTNLTTEPLQGWLKAQTNETGSLTVYCSFFLNGANQTITAFSKTVGNNSLTNIGNETAVAGNWSMNCYVGDGVNISQSNMSENLTISTPPNTPPTLDAVWLSPMNGSNETNISCYANVSDSTNFTLTAYYEWYLNGTNQTTLASSATISNSTGQLVAILDYSNLSVGDNWSCAVSINDSINQTGWVFSENSTIQAPINLSIEIGLLYPSNGAAFGPAQCWVKLITVSNITGSGNNWTQCRIYSWNGYANTSYVLYNSSNRTGLNLTFNFSTPVNTTITFYRVNCSAGVGTASNNSTSVDFNIYGSGFCPGGPNYKKPGDYNPFEPLEYSLLAMVAAIIIIVTIVKPFKSIKKPSLR